MAGWVCFHTSQLMQNVTCAPGGELQKRRHGGGRLDHDPVALGGESAVTTRSGNPDAGHRKNTLHGSDEIDESAQIVRRHVEDRPSARLEEEFRIRMPVLHAVRHQEGRSRQDASDLTRRRRATLRGARPRPGTCRGAAEEAATGLRLVDQLAALLEVDREGLLRRRSACRAWSAASDTPKCALGTVRLTIRSMSFRASISSTVTASTPIRPAWA